MVSMAAGLHAWASGREQYAICQPLTESELLLQALEGDAGSQSTSQSQQAGPPADRGDEEEAVRQRMAFALRSHPTDSFPSSTPLTVVWGSNGAGDSQPSAFLRAAGEAFSPKPLGLTIPHGVFSGALVAHSVQAVQGQAGSSAALRMLPDLDSWGSFSSKRTSLESPSSRLHSIEGHPAVFVNAGVPQVRPLPADAGGLLHGAYLSDQLSSVVDAIVVSLAARRHLLQRPAGLTSPGQTPPRLPGAEALSHPAACRNHGG